MDNLNIALSFINPAHCNLQANQIPEFMKYTQATLDRIEKLLHETAYIIRYERGTFQSGYCILEEKKVVVLNKFLQTEGRINTLIDIIPQLHMDPGQLSPESRKTYDEVMAKHEDGKISR